jgi:hypothetical protein
MRPLFRSGCAALLLCLTGLAGASAATATQTATVSATVSAAAVLTISANTITFPNGSPDSTPGIASTEGAISVSAKARTSANGTVTLTVLAVDDLKSGSDSVSISSVTWLASGAGFQAGTLSKTAAQTIGSWTGSGTRTGTLRYTLTNSFGYATGSYRTTLTYTLTAP